MMRVFGQWKELVLTLDYAVLNNMNTSAIHLPLTGLANHLVYDGLLTHEVALNAQQNAAQQNIAFITYITKNKILSSDLIAASCAASFGLSTFDLTNYNTEWMSALSPDIIRLYRVIPLKKHNGLLEVGISDPTERQTLDTVAFYTGLNVLPVIINESELARFLETHFNEFHDKKLELTGLIKELSQEQTSTLIQDNVVRYDEPLIKFVDHIIHHALQQSASDIHIEPHETVCRIRYRQDGILYSVAEIPIILAARLATRLKVMAKLDISERRLPQDGRFQLHSIDVRMNCCPTLFGEKIVLRLLNTKNVSLDIGELGFTEEQQCLFLQKISQPQGIVLVTGPTGSGKTVTLYSALTHLNQPEKNISTIEDPVEIQLDGINQVHINPKIGLHFSTALRTFLRQDPDIIMVGEIRDTETAEIATQAAQTGHLVLSTLHTNSAIETITRLLTMGIAPYNIVSSISLIIAQRLVRKLCVKCKQPEELSNDALQSLGLTNISSQQIIYRAIGCQYCLNGYHGRTGIYELLILTDKIIQLILANVSTQQIIEQAKQEGFMTLRQTGFAKVLAGITSLAEINRITFQ